jgi:hypothetical protein
LWLAKQTFKSFTTKHELEHQLGYFIFNISLPQLLWQSLKSSALKRAPNCYNRPWIAQQWLPRQYYIYFRGLTHLTQSLTKYACCSSQNWGCFIILKIISHSPYFEFDFYVIVLDAPYEFTPLSNLGSFIFGLEPFSFCDILRKWVIYNENIIFDLQRFCLHPLFQERN